MPLVNAGVQFSSVQSVRTPVRDGTRQIERHVNQNVSQRSKSPSLLLWTLDGTENEYALNFQTIVPTTTSADTTTTTNPCPMSVFCSSLPDSAVNGQNGQVDATGGYASDGTGNFQLFSGKSHLGTSGRM